NQHFEILGSLAKFSERNIRIYAPLSYGDSAYAQSVAAKGREVFGEKFIPLTKYLSPSEYTEFLSSIDIAVFNHSRQQAMSNTISLLGFGKKVFIRSDVAQWDRFRKLGIAIFDQSELDLTPLSDLVRERNQQVVRTHFSDAMLRDQYKQLFG